MVINLVIATASDGVVHFDHRVVRFFCVNVANEALDLDLHCVDFGYGVN